jgi:hypothetical protein
MRALRPEIIRGVVADYARTFCPLSASNPVELIVIADLCGPLSPGLRWPLDVPYQTVDGKTKGISTCGLVAEGILRKLGCPVPAFHRPYVFGSSIRRTIEAAQARGNWCTDGAPELGDLVVLGPGGNPHALTVVGIDGDTYESVDGGQTDSHGLQAVRFRSRRLLNGQLGGRVVLGWASCPGWWD